MPGLLAGVSAVYGAAYGLLPIGWIILNVLFLYNLCNQKGLFKTLQESLTTITRDRRLQVLLVAFCFGAFFEGAAGFGTPVAVSASILIGLGFAPLQASVLSLIANTAPVPFAGLGTPIISLQAVTGLDLRALTTMVAWQLAFFDLLIPFWVIAVLAGWKGNLACPAGDRWDVHRRTTAGGHFPRSLAGQYPIFAGVDGGVDPVPAALEAAAHLAFSRRG